MNILVVDDEAQARERLRRLLADADGRYALAGEATDGRQAIEICRSQRIDLVLLDVQIPGMNGLEAARALAALDPAPAVILVTAFEHETVFAFANRLAGYLVKPVCRERLFEALLRVQNPTSIQCVGRAGSPDSDPPRIAPRRQISAHYRGGLRTVQIEDVIYLRAEHKYVTVRHLDGELLIDESLRVLEQEFTEMFLRIHRNALVARGQVCGLEKSADGGAYIRLRDCAERLQVSRRHLPEVRRWVQGDNADRRMPG
ncbi:LytR/AlgR family response regulator transcription factor [Thiocapsa rosea]|uniref:LytTR family two component transcriptional regulator n=1 Tax=Thiocapsa rosea TaxID=69360 RepID=A0A495V4L1_9GAMM|nr:LytTR family DNA-binding domain-containing protein [Thiocapsa rosea]RKT44352.1 LytTR family two component transcriptional regulator [Thiocapsa rosea]